MSEAEEILNDLVQVLNNAFISSWQTVSWQKELTAAVEYLERNRQEKG